LQEASWCEETRIQSNQRLRKKNEIPTSDIKLYERMHLKKAENYCVLPAWAGVILADTSCKAIYRGAPRMGVDDPT
jgi:hypothetical protein